MRADRSSQTAMPPLGAGGVCVRMTLAAHLHLAQSQALPCLAAAIAFFPLGTRAFLLRVYKCCATDSFLPRKGRHGRYGVEFPQSCSASSFCVAAWLPWSGSVIFFFLAVDFFRALLALGCPPPWPQGKPGGTLPVPSSGEGASSFHGWLLPVCRIPLTSAP